MAIVIDAVHKLPAGVVIKVNVLSAFLGILMQLMRVDLPAVAEKTVM